MEFVVLLLWCFFIGYFIFLFVKNRKLPYEKTGLTQSKLFDDPSTIDISVTNYLRVGRDE